ncbi:alpha/beta hydrolase [Gracilinema caldarium]|uniref:alpha/beta hydrolase n=1 Tax=Gracilinema caldarium TaxID=215591 RepID=UPI0026F35764|nr:alpha/beta fold hydrolase [Gracilinema caldarium]
MEQVLHALLWLLVGMAGIWLLSVIFISIRSYILMFRPKFQNLEYCRTWGLEHGEFDQTFLSLPWELVTVHVAHRNAPVAALCLPAQTDERNVKAPGVAIFVHGITWTRYGMFKYMGPFIEQGWHVLAVDLPGHGDSPAGSKTVPSYGYHEKYDLDAVVDWARSRFGKELPVILVGESMGAGTVLQYAPLGAPGGSSPKDWKVAAIIADCSYTSAAEELEARLADTGVPRFIAAPVRRVVDWILQLFRGYGLTEPSPKTAVLQSPVPILFIHGEADTYVPTWMSRDMADRRRALKVGPTELVLVPEASHAKSVMVNRELWFSAVFDFLNRVLPQKDSELGTKDAV